MNTKLHSKLFTMAAASLGLSIAQAVREGRAPTPRSKGEARAERSIPASGLVRIGLVRAHHNTRQRGQGEARRGKAKDHEPGEPRKKRVS